MKMSKLASPRETKGKASSRASGDPYLCHSLQKEQWGKGTKTREISGAKWTNK